MGSYCSLMLGDYEIDQSKSYINTFWACFFNEDDKRSRFDPNDLYYTQSVAHDDQSPAIEYAASVKTMKLRLEIMGYTLENVKSEYGRGLERAIKTKKEYEGSFPSPYITKDLEQLTRLSGGGFDYWLGLIKYVFQSKIYNYSKDLDRQEDDIYRFLLEYNDIDEDLYLGYPNIGMGYFLRAALEAVKEEDELILDITSLIDSGYYKPDEPVCFNAARSNINDSLQFQTIIILTEGVSDSNILSSALKLLYPKIASYFSFLDFDSFKAEGGSAILEKTVKAFAAAGISNKMIALFDNDAAGVASTQRLAKRPLPPNVRIINLPTIPLAASYPTIGPQGCTDEDVNGRACSIEMYLGTDILISDSKDLTKVEWKGFEQQINAYQGELLRKAEIQKMFYKKAALATEKGMLEEHDWSGLKLVFESIFSVAAGINHVTPHLKYR